MRPVSSISQMMIFIKTQFEGIHSYPDAPEGVEFLKHSHRHMFHVRVWIDVFHNDREIEFILFKRYVESLLKDGNMNHKSCEMISDDLFALIGGTYPNRNIWIEISEDDENGSYKQYNV